MDDKSRIAEIRINIGSVFPGDISDDMVFHLKDQIGSSVIRLDGDGNEIDKEEYYPFGIGTTAGGIIGKKILD